MGVKGEAVLRALLQDAVPPTRLQKAHIREAMVRWRASAAERASLEQQLKQASAAERDAYQYLTGCLLAMQPDQPAWANGEAVEVAPLAATSRSLPAPRRALPKPRKRRVDG